MARTELIGLIGIIGLISPMALATDFSSSNFTSRDPVIDSFAGRSTSSSFTNIIAGGQTAIGESSSTNFIVRSGFLYFSAANSDSGGGGGGGGTYATINFSGIAFPNGVVALLKDFLVVATTTANSIDASFSLILNKVTPGSYNFALYATDLDCRRSSIITYPLDVEARTTRNLTDIFISPTIVANKRKVKKGETITIFGYTAPVARNSLVGNAIDLGMTVAEATGRYYHNLNSGSLAVDQYTAHTQSVLTRGSWISAPSLPVSFIVGDANILAPTGSICGVCTTGKGDLNSDCKVDLVDFSIAAFWWLRPLSPAFRVIEMERLNGDGAINLIDFSIMAYYWTG